MRIRVLRFNLYLTMGLVVGGVAGCKSAPNQLQEGSLRLHLEVNRDGLDANGPVLVGRDQPFPLNVEKGAFLSEFQIEHASVVDSIGGFSIAVQFNKEGTSLLEQYTTAHKGKHV